MTIIIKCKSDPHVLDAIRSIDHTAEIIVCLVKNPELRARIEACGVCVADAPDDNVGASCQIGLELARHEFCLISDSDCVFGPGYIAACLSGLQEADLCRGRIRFLADPTVTGSRTVARVRDCFNNVQRPPYMPGLAVRRSFAQAIGGFDCDIRWGVDHEFGTRALEAGARYRFHDTVWIDHLPITTAHDLRAAYRTGRAMRRLDRKTGVGLWPGRLWTCHAHEPYVALLRAAGPAASLHHFDWVRAFQAGYWALEGDR